MQDCQTKQHLQILENNNTDIVHHKEKKKEHLNSFFVFT